MASKTTTSPRRSATAGVWSPAPPLIAYALCHAARSEPGRWEHDGSLTVSFNRPVYHGDTLDVALDQTDGVLTARGVCATVHFQPLDRSSFSGTRRSFDGTPATRRPSTPSRRRPSNSVGTFS